MNHVYIGLGNAARDELCHFQQHYELSAMDADTNSHDTKRSSGKKANLILNDLQQEIDCGVPFQRTVILMKPAVLSKQITDHQHGAFHAEIEGDNITILSTEL